MGRYKLGGLWGFFDIIFGSATKCQYLGLSKVGVFSEQGKFRGRYCMGLFCAASGDFGCIFHREGTDFMGL